MNQRNSSGQDANAYAYVGGNPANFIDPSGLAETCVGETLAGVAAGAITGAVAGAVGGGPAAPVTAGTAAIGAALFTGAATGLACAFNNLFDSMS